MWHTYYNYTRSFSLFHSTPRSKQSFYRRSIFLRLLRHTYQDQWSLTFHSNINTLIFHPKCMAELRTANSICALPPPSDFTPASSTTLLLLRMRCLTQNNVFLQLTNVCMKVIIPKGTQQVCCANENWKSRANINAPHYIADSTERARECYSIGYQNIVGVKWAHEVFEQRLYKRSAYWSRALVIAWIYFNFKFEKVKMPNKYRDTWIDSKRWKCGLRTSITEIYINIHILFSLLISYSRKHMNICVCIWRHSVCLN